MRNTLRSSLTQSALEILVAATTLQAQSPLFGPLAGGSAGGHGLTHVGVRYLLASLDPFLISLGHGALEDMASGSKRRIGRGPQHPRMVN